ncbi:MAG: HD domain-containing protein, partial [Mucinivorans sp.]
MKNYRDFLDLITHTYSRASCITIVSALRYAAQQMRGMKRYGGQDFIMHSVGVAHIVVKEVGLGRNSTVAALLHDVFRLGKISPEQVKELYGEKCLEILRGLNNISQVDPKTSTLQAENFKEL